MFRCSASGLRRAARIGTLVAMVIGALTEFVVKWCLTRAAAHGPAPKLVIVAATKWAVFACLMTYWVLPPALEALQTRPLPSDTRVRTGLILSARIITAGLAVGVVTILADALTSRLWH